MKSSTFTFEDRYGVTIFSYKWEPDVNKPKASVMFLTGLADYGSRFEGLAKYLTDNDFICYVSDYRGHGKTANDISKLGVIGPGKGDAIPSDMLQLWQIMKNENPGIPAFAYGHSLGSMILQSFIQKHGNDIDGAILSGTTGKQDMLQLVKIVVKSELKKLGYDGITEKIHNMVLTSNNKPFKKIAKTQFDWLTRDEDEVRKYSEDPYCGFPASVGFYYELVFNPDYPWTKENEGRIPKTLPLLFIVGEQDSLTNNTKKVKALIKRYEKQGIRDITYKSYPNARHELHKELSDIRNQVFVDVVAWLSSKI